MSDQVIDPALQEMETIIAAVVKKAIKQFSDGFQALEDIMAMFPELMQIPQAVKDAPAAWAWMKDMTDTKADEMAASVVVIINDARPEVKDFVNHLIKFLAQGYMVYTSGSKLKTPTPTPGK